MGTLPPSKLPELTIDARPSITTRVLRSAHGGGMLHFMSDVTQIAFSPDRRLLASASLDGDIRVWDIDTDQARQMLRGHTEFVKSVAFHPNGK